MHRIAAGLMAALLISVTPAPSQAAETLSLKMGTLAPEGSPWLAAWYDVVNAMESRMPIPVKVTTYPGGVMGDEPDMVRKLKFGQLQMVGVTVSGIAQLLPEILVLNIPFLFNNYDEVDYVQQKLFPRFQELAEKRGLNLFAMTDSGFITAYSKKKVATPDEYLDQRVWVWNADPTAVKMAEHLGINSVMLPVPEVLTSLQTGLVDTMFSSSTALVALQWHTQMTYHYPITIRYDPAVMVTTKKAMDKIPPQHRAEFDRITQEISDEFLRPFTLDLRKTEKDLAEGLVEAGIKTVNFDPAAVEDLKKKAMGLWDGFAGTPGENGALYPPELLAEVKATLAEFRSKQAK